MADTMKIKSSCEVTQGASVTINKKDFDPKKHTEYGAKKKAAPKKEEKKSKFKKGK